MEPGPSTDTLEAARAHARSQAGIVAATGPTVPPTAATDLPEGVASERVVWDETVGLGGYAGRRLPRGSLLRVTDTDGDGCIQLLVFHAANTAERLNVADTVKIQWQAYLGPGALLLSDMGRVLMTIVADTSVRHDALFGCSNLRSASDRYGDAGVGGAHPNARDLLTLGVAKHGLSRRDVPPNINLFKGVRVATDGSLHFDGDPAPGAHVELRAELDVVVVVANTPHPVDPRPGYEGSTVRFTAWRDHHPDPDPFRRTSPERLRAFENSDQFLGLGR